MADRRPIVVTADDVGLRTDWDQATFEAHDRGFVQAVSVVANGEHYQAAVKCLRDRPRLQVGVHLNLLGEVPCSVAGEVPSLVDARGRLHPSAGGFVGRFLLGRIAIQEVAAEWRRQIERVFSDGLQPAFLNSHYHLHMLPRLFDTVVGLARRFDISHVRVTDEPPWLCWRVGPGRLRRVVRTAGLWILSGGARRRLRAAGLASPPIARGLGAGERLGVEEWQRLLRMPGAEPMEIVCHPWQSESQRQALASERLLREIGQRAELFSFRA